MFRARTAILAVAAVVIFASAPVLAQDHTSRIFLTIDYVSPNGDDDITINTITDAVKGSSDYGYEIGYEQRLGKIVGLEGSFLAGSNEFDFGDTELGELDQRAITAAVNFHIIPAEHFDLWLAPIASWYSFGELEDIPDGDDLSDEWGYGAQLGFDIGFNKTFAITGGVRYVKLDIGDVAFDPVIARVGVAFRFGERH